MYSSLSLGVAWARKSSTPASAAMAAAVSGLSPVIITERMPMARSCAMRSFMPPFTMSLRCTTPSNRAPSATARGVPPVARNAVGDLGEIGRAPFPPCSCTNLRMASVAPFRSRRPSRSTPLIRVWAEKGMKRASCSATSPAAQVVLFLGQNHDRSPLRASHPPGWRAEPHRPVPVRRPRRPG